MLVILAASALSQVALNRYLYGGMSLNRNHPPYCLARVIGDGPGRWYLQRHCAELQLTICAQLEKLGPTANDVLWGETGWDQSAPEQHEAWQREEMTVVLGALREYPWEEAKACARHIGEQLLHYSLHCFNGVTWTEGDLDSVVRDGDAHYARSRQAREEVPEDLFTSVQEWTLRASLLLIAAGLLSARRRMPFQLVLLTVTVAGVLLANAAVAGFSPKSDDRYELRLIWMVPMVAVLYIARWIGSKSLLHASQASAPN